MNRSARQTLLVGALCFLLAITLVATPAAVAQDEQVRLAIVPVGEDGGYFDLTMEPGETRDLSVQITNRGTTSLTARTYPADAYTIVNGGFAARLADEPISGTTRWIDYADERMDLAAGETVSRSLSVSVPEDTPPGQYIAALVVQNADPIGEGDGSGVGLNQVIRQTIAVAIRVPGPDAPEMHIGQVSHALVTGRSVVSFEIMNTGNVHLVPRGEFVLTSAEGAEIARFPIQMGTVYAGTATLVEAPLAELLESGDYLASLEMEDDTAGVRAESGQVPLTVPELDIPDQAPTVEPVAEPDTRPAAGTQGVSMPAWMILLIFGLSLLLGVLLTLVVILALRLRSRPGDVEETRPVSAPAQVPQVRKPATIRPLIPPSRRPPTENG